MVNAKKRSDEVGGAQSLPLSISMTWPLRFEIN